MDTRSSIANTCRSSTFASSFVVPVFTIGPYFVASDRKHPPATRCSHLLCCSSAETPHSRNWNTYRAGS
jgi:hypothetical protein